MEKVRIQQHQPEAPEYGRRLVGDNGAGPSGPSDSLQQGCCLQSRGELMRGTTALLACTSMSTCFLAMRFTGQ